MVKSKEKTVLSGVNTSNIDLDPFFFSGSIHNLYGTAEAPLTEPYNQHAYVYAGIKIIAQNLACVPFKVWKDPEFKNSNLRKDFSKEVYRVEERKNNRSIKTKFALEHRTGEIRNQIYKASTTGDFNTVQKLTGFEEVKSHEIIDLFDRPNPHMVGFELWESTITWLKAQGSCFWILSRSSYSEYPKEIWATGPKGWKPIVSEKKKVITGWEYTFTVAGTDKGTPKTIKLKPHEVIWFKQFDPNNVLKGLSSVRPALLSVEQDYEAQVYNRQFFKNGAQADVILETEEVLKDDHKQALLKSWEARHKGSRKAHKAALLDGGVHARVLRESHRDMEFRLLRELSRDEILSALGVPKAMAGVIEDVNRATFLGSKRTFFETTLIPIMEYITAVLYAELFAPIEPELYGFFDLALVEGLRGDVKEKAEVSSIYHNLGVPFNCVNDRFDLGFPHMDHGDEAFLHGTPIDQLAGQDEDSSEEVTPDTLPDTTDDEISSPTDETLYDDEKVFSEDLTDFINLLRVNEIIHAKDLVNLVNNGGSVSNIVDKLVDNILRMTGSEVNRKPINILTEPRIKAFLNGIKGLNPSFNYEKRDILIKIAAFARKNTVFCINSIKFYQIDAKNIKKTWVLSKKCKKHYAFNKKGVSFAQDGVFYPKGDCLCTLIGEED